MDNNTNNDLDKIEEKLKEEVTEEEIKKPISESGRSVFEIERIIKEKGKAGKEEKDGDSLGKK